MTNKTLPTPDVLRQLLRYEPDTGRLFWREAKPSMFSEGAYSAERKCRAWNGKYSGKEALTYMESSRPYRYGDIFGVKCYAHRVIIAMDIGYWPDMVDHINHDKSDNRRENLRHVSRAENSKNTPLRVDNSSGFNGVYFDKIRSLWCAEIIIDGKKTYLGRFKRKSDAAKARLSAAARLGFHPNHGRTLPID